MSTVVVSPYCDFSDNLCKTFNNNSHAMNFRNSVVKHTSLGGCFDKKTVGAQLPFSNSSYNSATPSSALRRSSSSGTSCANSIVTANNMALHQSLASAMATLANNNNNIANNKLASNTSSLFGGNDGANIISKQHQLPKADHRRLDRSKSESFVDSSSSLGGVQLSSAALLQQQQQQRQMANGGLPGGNSSRYKTELCRPFEESGSCKYGDKCQFAHGGHEVRSLTRHPKYKTELCRTFHTTGLCPYGPRCHFIHNAEEARRSSSDSVSPVSTTGREICSDGHHDNGLGSTGNSPPNGDEAGQQDSGCYLDDPFVSVSTPATPTVSTANLFSFQGHQFNMLITAAHRQQAKQQDDYNRAVLSRQFSLGAQSVYSGNHRNLNHAIDSLDSVFIDAPTSVSNASPVAATSPPLPSVAAVEIIPMESSSPPQISPVGTSDSDSASDESPLDLNRIYRLPIFSQLSINDD